MPDGNNNQHTNSISHVRADRPEEDYIQQAQAEEDRTSRGEQKLMRDQKQNKGMNNISRDFCPCFFLESCHARSLQKCGKDVIDGFAAAGLNLERKCRIREVNLKLLNVVTIINHLASCLVHIY